MYFIAHVFVLKKKRRRMMMVKSLVERKLVAVESHGRGTYECGLGLRVPPSCLAVPEIRENILSRLPAVASSKNTLNEEESDNTSALIIYSS